MTATHVCDFDRVLFGGGMACTICDALAVSCARCQEPHESDMVVVIGPEAVCFRCIRPGDSSQGEQP